MYFNITSPIFQVALVKFFQDRLYLIKSFWYSLRHKNAAVYPNAIHKWESPSQFCVDFIDCSKVSPCRPANLNFNLGVVYRQHKGFLCFLFQSLTTPGELIYTMIGSKVYVDMIYCSAETMKWTKYLLIFRLL